MPCRDCPERMRRDVHTEKGGDVSVFKTIHSTDRYNDVSVLIVEQTAQEVQETVDRVTP